MEINEYIKYDYKHINNNIIHIYYVNVDKNIVGNLNRNVSTK